MWQGLGEWAGRYVVVWFLPLLWTPGEKAGEWAVIQELMSTMGSLAFSPCVVTSHSAALCPNGVMNTAASSSRGDFPCPPGETQRYKEPPKSKDTGPPPTHFNTSSRSDSRLRVRFNHLLPLHWNILQQSTFSSSLCSWWLFDVSSYCTHWRCHPGSQQSLEGFSSC